ncbi:unnamed protein product [Effrenium voratum]|nr:unnamed protein product [Effrenium voratum]
MAHAVRLPSSRGSHSQPLLRSRSAPAALAREGCWNSSKELLQNVLTALLALLLLLGMIAAWKQRHTVKSVTQDFVMHMLDLKPAEAGALIFAATAAASVLCLPSFGLWLGAGVVFAHIYHNDVFASACAGTLATFSGLVVGGLAAFSLGRCACRRCITKRLQHLEWVEVLNAIVEEEGWKFVLIARMSPVLPLEAFNYACSITSLSTAGYIIGCLGSLPITAFWVWMGASAESFRMSSDDPDVGPGKVRKPVHTTLVFVVINVVVICLLFLLVRTSTKRYQRIMDQRIPAMAERRITHAPTREEHLDLEASSPETPDAEALRQEMVRLRGHSNVRRWRGMLSPRREG